MLNLTVSLIPQHLSRVCTRVSTTSPIYLSSRRSESIDHSKLYRGVDVCVSVSYIYSDDDLLLYITALV